MNRYLTVFILISIALFTSTNRALAGPARVEPQKDSRMLTVQEAVRLSLARSPEVLLSEAQAIRAREAIRETQSLNRPQIVTGTGLAYNNGMPLSMEGASPSIFQVSASQAIFSKKNNNLIREAEESGKASRLGAESARNELASRTALIYYQLHQSNKIIELNATRLELARKNQEQMATLCEAGRVRPVDLRLATTATQAAEQQLLIAQEQMRLAETELRELAGITDSSPIKTVEPQLDNSAFSLPHDALFRRAVENTPEILQLEAAVKAKEFHVEAERGEYLPKADIIGQYALFSKTNNYQDYFNVFTRNNFLIGLSLQVPIFDGFRANSRVAQSRHEVSEARYRLEGHKSALKLSIERILSALRISQGAFDLARRDTDDAREMVRMNEALLESGRIGPQEMYDARSLLHQKELTVLETDQAVFQKKLELLKAIGTASASLQ
jgi:outer membrane protein